MKTHAVKHPIDYNYLTAAQLSVFAFQLNICNKYSDFYVYTDLSSAILQTNIVSSLW